MKTSQKQTLPLGADASTCSQEDSRVSPSAWPDSGAERTMTATSGRKCCEQYVKSGPLGSLAKTLLESSRWFSPARRLKWEAVPLSSEKITEKEYSSGKSSPSKPSAQVLSEKVIPSSRLLFRLVPSERPTAGTASGLLPTVQTQGLKRCNADGKTEFMPMELLPTPTSIDSGSGRINKSPSPNAKDRPTIALAAKMGLLPSPVASDATTGAIIGKEDKFIVTKNGTPRKVNKNGENGSVGLARMVQLGELLPTPTTNDGKNSTIPESQTKRQQLPGVIGRNCPPSDGQDSPQLNPLFVEEMMGFPPDWLVSPFLSGEQNP